MMMAVNVDKVESTFFVPFKKYEEQDDGSVMVYGLASGPDVDLDGQRMDAEWLKEAMPDWMMRGNIREMHQPKAVGKAKEYQWTEDGPYVSSKIIDPDAVKKIKEGVYTGYSIGVKNAKVVPDSKAPGGKITDGTICEVSLVDYPAYPHSKFAIVKSLEKGVWQDMQTNTILEPITADEEKAVWSSSYIDNLPDSSFAYISPGKKDKQGKTTPRSLRHLPYKDSDGDHDEAHIRNALARLPQTDIPAEAKAEAKRKLIAAAKKVGIKVEDDGEGVEKSMDEEKTLTTDSGLSAPNMDGKPKKEEKSLEPDVEKGVSDNMSLDILTQMKDVVAQMNALVQSFGNSTFQGGEDNEGGGTVKETKQQEPDVADDLGVAKGAEIDLLVKTISDAITQSLTKSIEKSVWSGSTEVKETKEEPKQENEALNTILEKFNSMEQRLQKIENEPAAAAVDAMAVEHGINADTKKNYQGAMSDLASQISELGDKEREKLAAELIKSINGR